jgi:hypothetical protein
LGCLENKYFSLHLIFGAGKNATEPSGTGTVIVLDCSTGTGTGTVQVYWYVQVYCLVSSTFVHT